MKTAVTYGFNDTGPLAKAQYGDAGLRLNYWSTSETGDNYEHYDRFGCVGTQKWEHYTPSVTVVDQFDCTRDYAGNRLTRDIPLEALT